MNPTTVFCPNLACPARGQTGLGNIGIHSRKEQRFICSQCRKTFAATYGTVFYCLRTSGDLVGLIITLLAHGRPGQAIVVAFGLDERTVAAWGHVLAVRAGLSRTSGRTTAGSGRAGRRVPCQETRGYCLDGARHDGLHPVVAGSRG